MILDWSRGEWTLVWAVLGLFVGSFLNVAIHRYPYDEETVAKPRRSRCPSCKTQLTWRDNVPLISWILLRGQCRTCGWRIPWRYPFVEVLNAGLWALVAWRTFEGQLALGIVGALVLSALVVVTFVDLDWREIPDEISIGGIVLAPIAALLVPELHAHTLAARWLSDGEAISRSAAFAASLAGIAVGGGVLWGTGALGTRLFKKEAMGFGDVKLLAAGGGFVGPGGALVALMIGSLVGSFVGLVNILGVFVRLRSRDRARMRGRRSGDAFRRAWQLGGQMPFGPHLAVGIAIVLLYWTQVLGLMP